MYIVGSDVVDVRSDQQFRFRMNNFIDQKIDLLPQQVVTTASARPESVAQSHISQPKVVGSINDDRDTKLRKQRSSAHEFLSINKNSVDHRNQYMGRSKNR